MLHKHTLERLWKYEYWPYWVFYFPLYFYGIYLGLRSRSATYFSAANPGMLYGGVMGESKIDVLRSIPEAYLPNTMFLPANSDLAEISHLLQKSKLNFPLVAKPNIGERGKGVEKVATEKELSLYLRDYGGEDLIIQEFIDYPVELGILYFRHPAEDKGRISSVVEKDFLKVTGDGKNSVEELIKKETRAVKRLPYFRKRWGSRLQKVLPEGEMFLLEPIGNHSRGTTFLNANHLINENLCRVFDEIARQIEGYYYGRFDLKVRSLAELYEGRGIKILELNGVSSEPAHIYDPSLNIFEAYRDVFYHARKIWEISRENHRQGVPYHPFKDFLKGLKRHFYAGKNG